MLDAYREHKGTTSSVLCHLSCRVAVSLHKRHESCRCKCGIVYRRSFWSNMRKVMPYSTATLHELHLFRVDTHDCAIRVSIAVESDNEAIAERGNLEIVANTCHRTTGRHNIPEVVEQFENLLGSHRVRILFFNTRNLIGNTPVHVNRRFLIDIAIAIFHRILVDPHSCRQFISIEIIQRSLQCFFVAKGFISFHLML